MTRQEEITLARMVEMRKKLDTFENGVLVDLEKTYKNAGDVLLKQVKAAKGKSARLWTNTRLIAMLEEVQLQHQSIVQVLSTKSAGYVADAGVFSYGQMNNIVSWDGRVQGFNNVSLSKSQMQQLVTNQRLGGKTLNEWIGSALAPDIDTIKSNISTGLIAGEGYSKVVSRLQNSLSIGKGSANARDLESVVKTYMHSVNVKAQQDVYEANSSVVKQVEWSAILESGYTKSGRGTCPRCIALDGQRWATNNYNRPPCPLHVRCRCILVPITKTWRELGIDVDEMEDVYQPYVLRDKKGNALFYGNTDKTYGEWWKTQSKQFQDNSIGPRRADLVRAGKLEIPDMVDKFGNLVLLKDLGTFYQTSNYAEFSAEYGKLINDTVFGPYMKRIEYALKDSSEQGAKTPDLSASAIKVQELDMFGRPILLGTDAGMPSMEALKAAITNKEVSDIQANIQATLARQKELKDLLKEVDPVTKRVLASEIETNAIYLRKLEKEQIVADPNTTLHSLVKPSKETPFNEISARFHEINKEGVTSKKVKKEFSKIKQESASFFIDRVLLPLPEYNVFVNGRNRPSHNALKKLITLNSYDTEELIHELGHAIENSVEKYNNIALKFLKDRAGNEKLSEISGTPGEKGWKDKFVDHYVGKYYETGSTEVFSMGLEYMYKDPYTFFITDPEHFELILKLMWGAL